MRSAIKKLRYNSIFVLLNIKIVGGSIYSASSQWNLFRNKFESNKAKCNKILFKILLAIGGSIYLES